MKYINQSSWLIVAACSLLLLSGCVKNPAAPVSVPVEQEKQQTKALAVIVPRGGTYSRTISTGSEQTQIFFDQGLRFA